MSGFEPIAAQAVAAEVGTTALASEVVAANALAAANAAAYTPAIAGSLASIPAAAGLTAGLGALGSAVPGMYGVGTATGIPTLTQQLATASPEVLAQIQGALQPALINNPALASGLSGAPLSGQFSSAELANITNGIPNATGSGIQVAGEFTPEMMQSAVETTVPELTPEKLQQLQLENDALARVAGQYPQAQTNPFGDAFDMIKAGYEGFKKMEPKDKMLYGGVASLAAPTIMGMLKKKKELGGKTPYDGPLSKFKYDPDRYRPQELVQPSPYTARYATGGGTMMGGKGPMGPTVFSNKSAKKELPPATQFAVPTTPRAPIAAPTAYRAQYTQPLPPQVAPVQQPQYRPRYKARYAEGGISDLGDYSDYAGGGRMLKGPGDGMSDNIPASIAGKQPARLANEEFVIPADVVSHLGNGSSEAGAKQLYKMMDRVRQARTGKKKQGKQINPSKYMPV